MVFTAASRDEARKRRRFSAKRNDFQRRPAARNISTFIEPWMARGSPPPNQP
jgi:hypothetical protein